MTQYIEGTMLAALDASFDYGRPNISLSSIPVTQTGAAATGVQFNMSRPGNLPLVDALTWAIAFVGTVTGSFTVLLEGTNDGSNWFTVDTYTASANTYNLRSVSSHAGTGLPTHVLGLRARISSAGTGTGLMTVVIAA